MLKFADFQRVLRANLNHLFDPDYLRKSEVAQWLGIAGRYDTPTLLQKILSDEIEQLRPSDSAAHGGIDQQVYDILLFRYLQQSDPQEVAHQMGVSKRQLRRLQANALEILAYRFWKKYQLAAYQEPVSSERSLAEVDESSSASSITGATARQNDFNWLSTAQIAKPLDVSEEVKKVLNLIQPMAVQYQVALQIHFDDKLPQIAVHPVAFRQALLGILGELFKRSEKHELHIGAKEAQNEVELSILRERKGCDPPIADFPFDEQAKGIQDARHIIELSRGRLKITPAIDRVELKIVYPMMSLCRVLALDDNQDLIDLMTRYVDGTRYAIIGLSKPDQVIDVALRENVQVILLDVMMSESDGWEVLGRLRSHPQTSAIPIVICTILSQEELARVLGAAAFIQKPVLRERLLEVLDSLTL